jgi:hypothetical protein
MKHKHANKKLSLSKQTLQTMQQVSLTGIKGGAPTTSLITVFCNTRIIVGEDLCLKSPSGAALQ